MLTNEGAELLQGAVGLSKSEIKSIPSGMAKLFNNMKRSRQTQIVAKVVKAESCYAQVKTGDQLVFDPFLNPEKSTGLSRLISVNEPGESAQGPSPFI